MDESAQNCVWHCTPPQELKEKDEIDKLRAEEEQAGVERDYERAARKRPNACVWNRISPPNGTSGKSEHTWTRCGCE